MDKQKETEGVTARKLSNIAVMAAGLFVLCFIAALAHAAMNGYIWPLCSLFMATSLFMLGMKLAEVAEEGENGENKGPCGKCGKKGGMA
jgi:hypothetical protein